MWPLRYAAWISFNSLNAGINLTGNYGFIGFLNTAENLACTDDGFWRLLVTPPLPEAPRPQIPLLVRLLVWAALAVYLSASLLPLAQSGKGSADLSGSWVLRLAPEGLRRAFCKGLMWVQGRQ